MESRREKIKTYIKDIGLMLQIRFKKVTICNFMVAEQYVGIKPFNFVNDFLS